MSFTEKLTIGISACLLGERVRYDGGHKRDQFIADTLAQYCDFLPICPETAIGLGVPRPPIQLVGHVDNPRALGVKDPNLNVTDALQEFASRQFRQLPPLHGYILKKDSPSCGMERVKVYSEKKGPAERKGSGIFAQELQRKYPLLPVEEEGRLNDPVLRENFINRLFVYQRWQKLTDDHLTPNNLIEFHAQHKYLVMAHSQAAYKRMGQLLSDLKRADIHVVADTYIFELMSALKRRVNRNRHVNVLQHIMGYLKRSIDEHDKVELSTSIESYRNGAIPLIVPVTLLRHYFRHHPDSYIEQQVYMAPYPDELGLRNLL